MLGGGNPVGSSNPAGVGSSINYVGKHAYAYSGSVTLPANSLTRMLRFSLGNQYIVGTFQFEGDFKQLGNDGLRYQILVDGSAILDTAFYTYNDATYADSPTPILLPPNSVIEVLGTHSQGGVAIDFQAMIIGEVYA